MWMCVCPSVCAGYRYGKSLIPISDADEQAMKFESEQGLSLLGFTNINNIKWHQMVGNSVQCIAADPSKQVHVVVWRPSQGRVIAVYYQDFMFRNNNSIMRTIVWYRQLTATKILCASSDVHITKSRLAILFWLTYS